MIRRKLAPAALLADARGVVAALVAAGTGSAKHAGARSRRRGSTSARTTTAAGRRRTTRAGCTCRRRSARRSRRPTRRTSPRARRSSQVIESLVRDGNKIIFATSFGFQTAMAAAAKKYPDVKFEMATGTTVAPNMAEYFGAGEDAIYLSGMAAGAATKKGMIGYVVAVRDPRGDPARERVRARRAGDAPGRQGASSSGRTRGSTRRRRRRRPRASHAAGADVIGQNVDSPAAGQYAESEGIPWVGYDSDAQKFAPKSWLTAAVYDWGPYYLEARQGGDERHVEDRLLLREHEGRLHRARAVRPERHRGDEGGDRGEDERRSSPARSTSSQGPLYDQSGKLRVPKGKRLTVQAAVRDGLARQGRRGQREGLAADARRAAGCRASAPPRRCRPSRCAGSRSGSRASSRTTASTSRRPRARCTRCSARTAPARARSRTSSPGSTGPTRARSRSTASRSSSTRRATRSTPGSAWCTSTSGSSPPFTVAENVILGDHRGEGAASSSSTRARSSAASPSSASATGSPSTRARGSGSSRSASSSASRS